MGIVKDIRLRHSEETHRPDECENCYSACNFNQEEVDEKKCDFFLVINHYYAFCLLIRCKIT